MYSLRLMRRISEDNYYKLLNVPTDATINKIKEQYRILAQLYHPDLNGGVECQLFKDINNAY